MVAEEVEALGPWFHNLHLPDGTQTAAGHPFGDFPTAKWEKIAPHLPEDLRGWSALDMDCNAGFYGFELARRGAQVIGIDVNRHYLMRDPGWPRMAFIERRLANDPTHWRAANHAGVKPRCAPAAGAFSLAPQTRSIFVSLIPTGPPA